ncbi:MAG: translation initiation factor IF-2 [Bacteroidota bacterium]
MPGKKRNYRLFQVAKELNVGTSLLVEHLQDKGHDIDNSPNSKIDSDLYAMLLKQFASEKQMKERADQILEKRKEERVATKSPEEGTTEEEGEDPISASDLRNRIKPKRRRKSSPDSDQTEQPQTEAAPPASTPPVAETPPPTPTQEKDDQGVGLRVVGKVDLNKFKAKPKPTKKDNNRKSEPPAAPKAKAKETTPPAPKADPQPQPQPEEKKAPVAKTEKPAQPVVEKKPAPPVEKPQPQVEKPQVQPQAKVEPPKAPAPPKPEEKKATPAKQEAATVAKATQSEKEEKKTEESTETESGVIRAGDRAPNLRGLKVMGKIELPSDRRKRKGKEDKSKDDKKDTAKPATAKTDNGDSDDAKKKRRRRRKRKRKPSEGDGASSNAKSSNNSNRGNRKEKPSEKEVDQSIKNTLSQMGRGASRNRQRQRRAKRDAFAERRAQADQMAAEEAKVLELTEFITANEFAQMIEVPVNDIITKSFQLGMMVSINQRLEADLLSVLGEEFGYEIKFVDVTEKEIEIIEEEDDPEDLIPRNPIITVMGHVDHGKTTLLDHLRKANVAAGEAGGITQHIGAYQVNMDDGKTITFLDTPGHEAFTAMRARGAKVTDVAIIVVAADDAVMPQTREAINHAQVAEVPMVFALNKIDKAGAEPEKIKSQLAEMNLLVDDWGGPIQSQEISALKGMNVEDLLEKVVFESEILELKANPDRAATGTVIEARLDRGRGNVATFLIQNGTLRVGDEMVAGIHYGKVRALIDQKGNRIKEAGPSMPVQVLGLTGQPTAGDKFYVFTDDGKAKEIANKRQELFREQQLRKNNRLTLEEIGRRKALGNFEELNVIIRADVDGSVEALSGALMKLSTEEVQVNIIWKAVGAITEADVNLAIASEAIVMAFNVRPNSQARSLAEREDVDIRTYSVIYDAIDDVRDALEGLLSPEIREEKMGTAEVLEVFKITKVGNVAGGLATSGKIDRNNPVRLIRDGIVIYENTLGSLKRFKDDAKEVIAGQEFGFTITNYDDIKAGDTIESFKVNEIRRKLKS